MQQVMQIRARAKINWCLNVVGKRPDGYHLLDGVMQPLTLCDCIDIAPSDGVSLHIAGANGLTAGEDNLILRAAKALQAAAGASRGAAITLTKRIPMGAGLGGGSADCAAALKGLNAFWQLGLSMHQLLKIGETLGADVPFCLMDAPCRAQGIGEMLTPVPVKRTFPLVLVQPCQALSTKEVFAAYHQRQADMEPADVPGVMEGLAAGDLQKIRACARNELESASIPLRPEITQARAQLIQCGASMARMTGSGSVVFGAFETLSAAQQACEKMQAAYPVCLLTETAL